MKKEITLKKRGEIQALQELLIYNADGVNIEGDGNSIVHSENFPLKHTFADGIYIRQMEMKAGSMVVGAIHNHLHVWFLLTGHLAVATEDSIFINIHKNPNNIKDINELESEIVSKTFEEYEQYIKK